MRVNIKQGVVAGLVLIGSSMQAQADTSSSADSLVGIEEITVTGTFIKRKNQADTTSPIQVVGSEDLSDIAAFSPSDLVATLPANSGSQNETDGFNQTFSLGTTNVNLRGLGVSSTLTLINGRRQTLSAATTLNGDQFVDLNSLIPSIAIDRVEVLEDGASSLYGSDAVAGVVNFIARKNFEGAEVDLNYSQTATDAQNDTQFSGIVGKSVTDNLHLIAALSYFDRNSLSADERRNEFELRNASSIFGQPATYLVFPAAGAPVRTADPACSAVAATDNDVTFISAGPIAPTCQFDFGDFFSLVAEEERLQFYTYGSLALNDSSEMFAELGYAKNEVASEGSPSQPILFPPMIPDSNPAAADLGIPSGGRALMFGRVDGAGAQPSETTYDYETYRFAAGITGDINSLWSWEAGVTYSENTFDYLDTSDTRVDRYLAALNGVGGPNNDQYFNPLFGADNDQAVREDFRGEFSWGAEASLFTVDAHVSGEFLNLPAGSVGVAAGVQYRDNELTYKYSEDALNDNLYFFIGNDDFSDSQDVYAAFVEADVPVTDSLSLQLAIRYEDFGEVDTTDPKIGVLWRASNNLSLRATYGTSFRAPSIFQQVGQFRVPARIFDPVIGDFATVSQETLADPDQALQPQESDTYNVGITWDDSDRDFSVSLDYWRFEYSNFITPENATALVATDPFGEQVIRDSGTNALLSVTTFYRNAGLLETDGLDLSISKSWVADGLGEIRTRFDATRVLSYDLSDPILGDIDGLGSRNYTNFGVPTPEVRGSIGLLWNNDRHSANIFVRYIDAYEDDNNAGAKIDSYTVTDVQYRYLADGFTGLDQSLAITIGAKNVFDSMPPDVVSRTGYDALTHSPLGAQIYLGLKQSF